MCEVVSAFININTSYAFVQGNHNYYKYIKLEILSRSSYHKYFRHPYIIKIKDIKVSCRTKSQPPYHTMYAYMLHDMHMTQILLLLLLLLILILKSLKDRVVTLTSFFLLQK